MILFPLKKHCSTTTDVIELIQKIFTNIKQEKDLNDFNIVKEKNKGQNGAVASSLIIEPTSTGTKVAFGTIRNYFSD
jgi:hypothetical protein